MSTATATTAPTTPAGTVRQLRPLRHRRPDDRPRPPTPPVPACLPLPVSPPAEPVPALRPAADERRSERGQATAEYALVVLAAAALAGLLLAWAAGTDGIGRLFDAVMDSLIDRTS